MAVLILFSALSGLVTVLSPCILPVLPIVLSSTLTGGKKRPIGVVAELITSFSIFTLALARLVSRLGLSANALRISAVIIIGLLGVALIVSALNLWMEKALGRLPGLVRQNQPQGSWFGAGFLSGAGLGLIWAPCAGPILAAVITLAATQTVSLGAGLVVAAYAIGAGIPLLAIAYTGRSLMNRIPFLVRNAQRLQQSFGVIMVLTAGLIAFNADTLVSAWVTSLVPASWTSELNGFEKSPGVTRKFAQLSQAGTPGASNPAYGKASPTPAPGIQNLPDLGQAPELTGINHWINSDPLTIKGLRGKVILVDFWTYSCINCIHTLPYVTGWYNKYREQGFVVIGVHTPEFAFEHDTANVIQAARGFNIVYPIAQDNDFATWKAYSNQHWPAEYLIDANGHLRLIHLGEGNYNEMEKAIQELLAEASHS